MAEVNFPLLITGLILVAVAYLIYRRVNAALGEYVAIVSNPDIHNESNREAKKDVIKDVERLRRYSNLWLLLALTGGLAIFFSIP